MDYQEKRQEKYLMMWELGVLMNRQAGVSKYIIDIDRDFPNIRR
jgi:hypothetical protein